MCNTWGVHEVRPKSLLLDLLRVSDDAVQVSNLVAVGNLFGFEGNAVRVALTRLVAAGLVESDERSSYRLAPGALPMARLINRWRDGEARLSSWAGDWLAVLHPRGGDRRSRADSLRALARLGFREGRPGMWVRPNNLRADAFADLSALGLVNGAEAFTASGFGAATEGEWRKQLWPLAQLRRDLRDTLRDLERSRERLPSIPRDDALVESFLLGGRAIRLLATDPLLPDEILDGDERRRLTKAMKAYDRAGKKLWLHHLTAPAVAPTHLAVVG